MLSLPRTLTVLNLTMIVLSFGSQRHSFLCWTCVCVMLLRKITFKQRCLKIVGKQ
ncbi:cell shape-determining protein MreC [Vibrio cholerae]|uniref:cell shape-determining protein MreC n=2 Tax=Vibrionaceae TaxID=641 RepID=UPI003966F690